MTLDQVTVCPPLDCTVLYCTGYCTVRFSTVKNVFFGFWFLVFDFWFLVFGLSILDRSLPHEFWDFVF
jgi:hypothetical protein